MKPPLRRVHEVKPPLTIMELDLTSMMERSDQIWENSILPSLSEMIEIKALSPLFEPKWSELGELDAAIDLFRNWLDEQDIKNL